MATEQCRRNIKTLIIFCFVIFIVQSQRNETITCGEVKTGVRGVLDEIEYEFTSNGDYHTVYLEGCGSEHDIYLEIKNSSGHIIQSEDDQFKHGTQANCSHSNAGDITIPYNVSIGDIYTFIVKGYSTTSGSGPYTVELFCERPCYSRGPCNAGYMDKTDGNYFSWSCGDLCEGGRSYTDVFCNCACLPSNNCSIGPTPAPSELPPISNKYIFVTHLKSWDTAQEFCESEYNSDLATIITDNDIEIVRLLKETERTTYWEIWIGLNDKTSEGIWEWQDGASCDYVENGLCRNDTHWANGEPNNSDDMEDCAVFRGDGEFNDQSCSDSHAFLCNNATHIPTAYPTTNPTMIPTTYSQSITCGQVKTGIREASEEIEYQFISDSAYIEVYLEGCESKHDIHLEIKNSSGHIIQSQDDQYNHGTQSNCNDNNAGDITIPNSVSIGDIYTFVVKGFGVSEGSYTVELFCTGCHEQGHCDAGYVDKTDGNHFSWSCGDLCEGGRTYTDAFCNCACVPPNNNCSIGPTSAPSALPPLSPRDKYIFVTELKTWYESQQFCESRYNSDLATIITDEDMEIVYLLKSARSDKHHELWIGLNDQDDEGIWQWKDGTSCDYVENGLCRNDTHWADGEPNNGNHWVAEHCGAFRGDKQFNDLRCLDKHVFLCNDPTDCVQSNTSTNKTICERLNKYILVTETESWDTAQQFCQTQYGSDLATIITDQDLEIAVTLRMYDDIYYESAVWIGLNDKDIENEWVWTDGTSCDYVKNGLCANDRHWNVGQSNNGDKDCAALSSEYINASFRNTDCGSKLIFLCNNKTYTATNNPTTNPTTNPTMSPTTKEPTINPSTKPTKAPFVTDNIIITMDNDISSNWIAFNISNVDVSCGGFISNVEITDDSHNKDAWIKYSRNVDKYYEFNNLSDSFEVPISIKITKTDLENSTSIEAHNVIYLWEGGISYDFKENFCVSVVAQETIQSFNDDPINYTFYYVIGIILLLFMFIGILSLLDAKCFCRKNDHFHLTALISAWIQQLDMVSDIFFVIDVGSYYNKNQYQIQFLIICLLSVLFIIIPIIISLFQLYAASSKHWLNDNRIREWLVQYSKLLYFASVFTGSSFTAIEIFNSNLFGLDLFYIGLSKQYLLGFSTKKVYSIVLFENCPQLILITWFTLILQKIQLIPMTSIIFSLISIIVTIISMILQKRIYKTQDYVYITIDIKGKSVMDNLKICRNRIKNIKLYLCRSVLGVNEKSVEIMKPFDGSICDGLQLQIHISYIHNKSKLNPADHYDDLLDIAIQNNGLQTIVKEEWELSELPQIENVSCIFIKSKEQRQMNRGKTVNDEEVRLQDTENMKQRSIDMMAGIELETMD